MSKEDEEKERQKFIEENPESMKFFNKIVDNLFGKKEKSDENQEIK